MGPIQDSSRSGATPSEVEAEEVALTPLEEARELELIYRAKGLEREPAKPLAQRIIAD